MGTFTEAMSKRHHREREKPSQWEPLPPSLEEAFEAVENLDARHPTSRGMTYDAIRNAEEKIRVFCC